MDDEQRRNEIETFLAAEKRKLSKDGVDGLNVYLKLLLKWNAAMNLTGHVTLKAILAELVLDSFYLADFLAQQKLPEKPLTLDLGAGSGMPGIPLRLVWQRGTYVLVERGAKRAIFLRTVLAHLALPNTLVCEKDVQNLPEKAGKADIVLARAFMPWGKLLTVAKPLLAPAGILCIMAARPLPEKVPGIFSASRMYTYHIGEKTRWLWIFENGQRQ